MKKILTLLLCLMATVSLSAQIRGNSIEVMVQPDHQDWTYKTGEQATFVISVLKSGTLLDHVSIDYQAGPEMYQDVKKSVVLKDGTLKLTGTMKQPGFYRVDVTAHVGGKDYKGACGAGFLARAVAALDRDAEGLYGLLAKRYPGSPQDRTRPDEAAFARAMHERRERV